MRVCKELSVIYMCVKTFLLIFKKFIWLYVFNCILKVIGRDQIQPSFMYMSQQTTQMRIQKSRDMNENGKFFAKVHAVIFFLLAELS